MAKINLTINLDKYTEYDVLEYLEYLVFTYNYILLQADNSNRIQSEICDNGDGSIEFRILDFIVNSEDLDEIQNTLANYGRQLNNLSLNF